MYATARMAEAYTLKDVLPERCELNYQCTLTRSFTLVRWWPPGVRIDHARCGMDRSDLVEWQHEDVIAGVDGPV